MCASVSPNYVELRTLGDVSGTLVGREGQELSLECVAYGGSPAPSIIWHLGGDLTDEAVPFSQVHRYLSLRYLSDWYIGTYLFGTFLTGT